MKNKNITFYIFLCAMFSLICACSEIGNHITNSQQVNKQQLDLAKFTLYKVNSYLNCDCKAIKVSESQGDVRDTVNVLSLNLALDTIEYHNDTIIYFFDYTKIYDKVRKLSVLSSPYNGCAHYRAIAFSNKVENEKMPLYLLIDEDGYMPYSSKKSQEIDAGFKNCTEKNSTNLNAWLEAYLNNQ
jgi:hypothetical protein